MPIEMRSSQRYAIALPVEAVGPYHEGSLQAVSDNISGTGIYFRAEQPLRQGDAVSFHLKFGETPAGTFPSSVRVQCRGRVLRVEKKGATFGMAVTIDHYQFEK